MCACVRAKRLRRIGEKKMIMVSLRMPPDLVERVKRAAGGGSYQALLRQWAEEKVKAGR